MNAKESDNEEAYETGIQGIGIDSSGEYEIELTINEHKGRCWLSKEMWEAIGEHAGWSKPSSEEIREFIMAEEESILKFELEESAKKFIEGGHKMDGDDGPVCNCGQPSQHQSGWCGKC